MGNPAGLPATDGLRCGSSNPNPKPCTYLTKNTYKRISPEGRKIGGITERISLPWSWICSLKLLSQSAEGPNKFWAIWMTLETQKAGGVGLVAFQTSQIYGAKERKGGGHVLVLHYRRNHSNDLRETSQELGQGFIKLSERHNIHVLWLSSTHSTYTDLDGWLKSMVKSTLPEKLKASVLSIWLSSQDPLGPCLCRLDLHSQ